jgi:hypothetical protein
VETTVIYDSQVTANTVVRSNGFTNGQVLIFDSPSLPTDESIEFGVSVVGNFTLIGSNREKLLPITFLDGNFNLLADTSLTLYLPREISETGVQTYCYFNSTVTFNLRAYCIRSSVTQESISSSLEDLKVREFISDAAIITNQIAQNTALGILGVALSPVTLGASLAVEPALLGGTSILTPILLPAL